MTARPSCGLTPIFTRDVFERIAVELTNTSKEPTKRTVYFLQIVHCGVCGLPLTRLKGGVGRSPRYRCATLGEGTGLATRNRFVDYADVVEGTILRMLGESERLERVWDSGSDHSAELAEINARLVDLTGQLGTGVSTSRDTAARGVKQVDHQPGPLGRQSSPLRPLEPAGCREQARSSRDWWGLQDTAARKHMAAVDERPHLDFDGAGVHLVLGDLFDDHT